MNEPENCIIFQDTRGDIHDIRIERIMEIEIPFPFIYRYRIWFITTDGNHSYCYLDEDDPTNYVVYKGTKYTNRDFKKLVLAVQNENNLSTIEKLD